MNIGDYVEIIKVTSDSKRYVGKTGTIKRVIYEIEIDPLSGEEGTELAVEVKPAEKITPKTEEKVEE